MSLSVVTTTSLLHQKKRQATPHVWPGGRRRYGAKSFESPSLRLKKTVDSPSSYQGTNLENQPSSRETRYFMPTCHSQRHAAPAPPHPGAPRCVPRRIWAPPKSSWSHQRSDMVSTHHLDVVMMSLAIPESSTKMHKKTHHLDVQLIQKKKQLLSSTDNKPGN